MTENSIIERHLSTGIVSTVNPSQALSSLVLSTSNTSESFYSFLHRQAKEIIQTKFALVSFVNNNLRRRYRRSVLGFAWSLINPLVSMAILTMVFSHVFHRQASQFAVYLFSGLLPWTFITDSIIHSCPSIVSNEHYLKKIYVPKLFFPMVAVSTQAANFCLSLIALMLLGSILGMPFAPTMLLLPGAIILLYLFNLSVGLFLAVVTVYFRDLTHIAQVVLNAVFYLMPIIYTTDAMPESLHAALALNPFFYQIKLFRLLICDRCYPAAVDWAIPAAITLIMMSGSLYLLYRREKDIIFRL